MPVLSIIACGMLEDELVHVLIRDCEIRQLIVVENNNISGFLRKLRSGGLVPRVISLDRVPMLLETGFSLVLKRSQRCSCISISSGK